MLAICSDECQAQSCVNWTVTKDIPVADLEWAKSALVHLWAMDRCRHILQQLQAHAHKCFDSVVYKAEHQTDAGRPACMQKDIKAMQAGRPASV